MFASSLAIYMLFIFACKFLAMVLSAAFSGILFRLALKTLRDLNRAQQAWVVALQFVSINMFVFVAFIAGDRLITFPTGFIWVGFAASFLALHHALFLTRRVKR
jgi:hypothetical protein